MALRYRYNSIRNGLACYYRPSRGPTGNTLFDPIGYNNGTLTGGPTWEPSVGYGYALYFNSTYVNSTQSKITGYPLTIACWFYLTALGSSRYLFTLGNESAANNYVALNVSSTDLFEISTRSGAGLTQTQVGSVAINTWHLVTATINDTPTQYLYANGLLLNSGASSFTPNSFANVNIGRLVSRGLFGTSTIDACMLWNRMLSAREILTLYNAGRGGLDQRINTPIVRGTAVSATTNRRRRIICGAMQ